MISKVSNHIQRKASEDVNFWTLLSFFPTFVICRILVYNFPWLFLEVKGVHIHHFTYGIIILAVSGLIAQNVVNLKWKNLNAMLYGAGLALAFDEFGMWIHLEDNYWIRQSYDAVVIIFSILVNVIYLSFFWKKIFGKMPIIGDKII